MLFKFVLHLKTFLAVYNELDMRNSVKQGLSGISKPFTLIHLLLGNLMYECIRKLTTFIHSLKNSLLLEKSKCLLIVWNFSVNIIKPDIIEFFLKISEEDLGVSEIRRSQAKIREFVYKNEHRLTLYIKKKFICLSNSWIMVDIYLE